MENDPGTARTKVAGIDLNELKDRANAGFDSNRELADRLKNDPPHHLNKIIHEEHHRQFKSIDCLDCANCCKTTPALIVQEDMNRIAVSMGIAVEEFLEQYVVMDEDGDFVTNSTPCPFLEADNKCRIYEVRPQSCREFPLTLREDQADILDITLDNAAVCPAVFRIFERLSAVYPL